MSSRYQHTAENPFHISVGAVLVNDQGEILAHKVLKKDMPPDVQEAFGPMKIDEAYMLMRESLEEGETLEEAVLRGLQEEFGCTGKVKRYLGSIQARAFSPNGPFEKTTLYFEVSFIAQGERQEDDESYTKLEWHTPEFLMEHMRIQGKQEMRGDLDESKILETYVK